MRRRQFLTLLGGAAAGWPLAAGAQERDQFRHVGVLMATTETDADGQSRWNVFRKRVNELGWIEDRNLRFDIRWAGGNIERFREYAAALALAKPDVILADATPSTAALLHETRTVPIVFVRVSDPAGQGFVKNLARPDGNVTGFTNFEPQLAGKWVQLLKDLVPNLAHVSFIYNPQTAPYTGPFIHSFEAAARELGMKPIVKPILQSTDIDAFIAERDKEPSAGMVVQTDAFMVNHRDLIVAAAARYKGASDLSCSAVCSKRRLSRLWHPTNGIVSGRRAVCRSYSQGCEARRSAGAGADQVRAGHQSQDRKGPWP
jgi:putative tryptophan/tyrosine transport system substrate-binding protein